MVSFNSVNPLYSGSALSLLIILLVGLLFYQRQRNFQSSVSSEFKFLSRLFMLSLAILASVITAIGVDSIHLYKSISGVRLEHLDDSERILASYYLNQVWAHLEQITQGSDMLLLLFLPGVTAVCVGIMVLLYGRKLLLTILQERAFNQDILDAIADPIFVKGDKYEWRGGNKAFWRLVDAEASQVIGTNNESINLNSKKEMVQKWEYAVIGSNITDINEEVLQRPNGKDMHAIVTRSPLKLPDGSRGLVGVIHDITHLKDIERELADHRDNLERKVEEQTETLKIALKEAETVSELKSDFLANMSHELRTPLNSIIGMASLMMEDDMAPEQLEMARTLENASKNLLDIVNDILDLSKIESGALELEYIAFDAQQSISNVVNMLKPLASKKNLSLNWYGKTMAPIFVLGDPLRYERIVTNLLGNAIKYTESGQIEVFLDTTISKDGKRILKLIVRDTGIGMSDSVLNHIFDKFTQADSSTTRKYGGSGLGLAITKQLVDKMHGAISVESEQGKGSTFIARIPFDICSGLGIEQEQHIPLNQCGILRPDKVRVLIAEDHQLNQVFIRRLLKSIGIQNIQLVENGLDALEAIKQGGVDLVLMDCHMPTMNGYDATAAIRNLGSDYEHLPIIAMTANAMAGEKERCIAIGMDDYISKPVDKKSLVKILAKWINLGELLEQLMNAEDNMADYDLPVLDLTSIRSFSGDDKDLEREFAGIFVEQSTKHLEELAHHIVDGQSQAWVETAHLLKGGAATMGAMQMRALSAKAQQMFNAPFADREEIYFRIKHAFMETKRELSQQISQQDFKIAGGALL